jgi:multidrug efflux pump subunit AcrA (membrane-fusion protein)
MQNASSAYGTEGLPMITSKKITNKFRRRLNPLARHRLLLFFLLILSFVPLIPGEIGTRVKQGEFLQTVILTGSLKATKAEHFIVPITSTWQIQIKWMVKEGAQVKSGDPVVRFDTANLAGESENLELSLQTKEEGKLQQLADYNHQEFELSVKLKQSEIDYKKKELDASIPKGLESNFNYDTKQLEFKRSKQSFQDAQLTRKVKLASLKSGLKKLDLEIQEERAKLEKTQALLKSLTLTAKTSGTVVYENHRWENRKMQIGDNVPATWTVATIPAPARYK